MSAVGLCHALPLLVLVALCARVVPRRGGGLVVAVAGVAMAATGAAIAEPASSSLRATPATAAGPLRPAESTVPQLRYGKGLLFRLDKPGVAPSWVFGTIHSDDPRVTALPVEVVQAFAASRSLAPEIQLGSADLEEHFAGAQLDDSRRLADVFDPDTLARIRLALGASAASDEAFARMKPWAVLLKLAEALPATGPGTGTGEILDQMLVRMARERRMSVVVLELPDEQIASFDVIPLESQAALVRDVLDRRGTLVIEHEKTVRAWLDRDPAALRALGAGAGRRDPVLARHYAEVTRHLVDNRSAQMAHRLFLPLRSGRVFVAVGAMHLPGDQGLLALLRAQGYAIRRVWRRRRGPAADGRACRRRPQPAGAMHVR